jgi:hypothetical protein
MSQRTVAGTASCLTIQMRLSPQSGSANSRCFLPASVHLSDSPTTSSVGHAPSPAQQFASCFAVETIGLLMEFLARDGGGPEKFNKSLVPRL